MKEDIEKFVKWMFVEKNRVFVKTAPDRKIAQLYNSETNSSISHTFVGYHRFRWILVDHKPYDITRIPDFILKSNSFKKYSKENNLLVETLDGPIWNDLTDIQPNDVIVENI